MSTVQTSYTPQMWVDDLASGRYLRTRKRMKVEVLPQTKFCCLGVLKERVKELDGINLGGVARPIDLPDWIVNSSRYMPEGETPLLDLLVRRNDYWEKGEGWNLEPGGVISIICEAFDLDMPEAL